MTAPTTERVEVADGAFDLWLWSPAGDRGPGLLLVPEIFGRSSYIEETAERLAGDGYLVGVPDLFWRLRPGWGADHDETGLQESLALGSQYDPVQGAGDCVAALAALAARPETGGRAGVLGFCLGGSTAYLVAADADPTAVVSYYGSLVPDALDRLDDIRCPLLLHFGGSDPYIARDAVRRVEEAAAGRRNVEVVVQEQAGHAFDNFAAPMFHVPDARAAAWQRTAAFLAEHLPVEPR